MEEQLLKNIELLQKKLIEQIKGHNHNANNMSNAQEERKRANRIALFLNTLNNIVKKNDKNLLFDYANEIYVKIQEYNENQEMNKEEKQSYEYNFADYQYILITILNLFPNQKTTLITNVFDKELSKKVIEKINTFRN